MTEFYKNQPKANKDKYKALLKAIGSLSRLFSDSDKPFLYYRAHENAFCYAFDAENLARSDDSADAKKDLLGIGLKTWVGRGDQKVAEFGELKPEYKDLEGIDLVKKISEYRNIRIDRTLRMYGLDELLYHVVRRNTKNGKGIMEILEMEFDKVDIEHIRLINDRGNENNTYFTDGKHTYHFSTSKNTLYMIFDNLQLLEEFDVEIKEDIFERLEDIYNLLFGGDSSSQTEPTRTDKAKEVMSVLSGEKEPKYETLCLRLYSTKGKDEKIVKYVAEHSGLNQWNGVRTSNRTRKDGTTIHKATPRDENELYIPYPSEDRKRKPGFFPGRDVSFDLQLPDRQWISAKVCQDDGKAIMSNPNNVLGKWLLRDVFQLPTGKVLTYEDLLIFGVDCVLFKKLGENKYSIDFCEIGTYERLLNEDEEDPLEENE